MSLKVFAATVGLLLPLWFPEERAALAPPPKLTVSQWADAERILSRGTSVEEGRWRTDRTPPAREVMDALGDPSLEEVVIRKPAQVGGSEWTRNFLGYAACCQPGPTLVVFSVEEVARENLVERIAPMIRDTPALRKRLPGGRYDVTKSEIHLDRMPVYVAWAGSAAALATRPIRYVILDEVDKYPTFAGKESSPVALAKARTRTYGHKKKVILVSTPTTALGAITVAFDSCRDRRYYHVPCSACGVLQPLVWNQIRVENATGTPVPIDSVKRAEIDDTIARLENGEAKVSYECQHCKHCIPEDQRDRIVERGEWLPEGYENVPKSEWPKTRRRAYQVSVLAATIGVRWSDLVIKRLGIKDDVAKLMEFVNQDLGEPFLDQIAKVEKGVLERKAERGHARAKVPRWAGVTLLTVDTQKDYFYWVLRAWGRGERSRLIDLGIAKSFEDLDRIRKSPYPIEGYENEVLAPSLTLIDVGGGTKTAIDSNRTDEVYRWAMKDQAHIACVKGHGGRNRPAKQITHGRHTYKPPGALKGYEVRLFTLDTQYFKDVLAGRIDETKSAPEAWELCEDLDEEYFAHLTAEHKVAIRRGQSLEEVWQPLAHGRRVDYLDDEVYQLAGAKIAFVEHMQDEESLCRERDAAAGLRTQAATAAPRGLTMPDGRPFFINRRRT